MNQMYKDVTAVLKAAEDQREQIHLSLQGAHERQLRPGSGSTPSDIAKAAWHTFEVATKAEANIDALDALITICRDIVKQVMRGGGPEVIMGWARDLDNYLSDKVLEGLWGKSGPGYAAARRDIRTRAYGSARLAHGSAPRAFRDFSRVVHNASKGWY